MSNKYNKTKAGNSSNLEGSSNSSSFRQSFNKSLLSSERRTLKEPFNQHNQSQNFGDSNLTGRRTLKRGKENLAASNTTARQTQVLDPLDNTVKDNLQLNKADLSKIYDKFKIFPNKHRPTIWSFLLGLPRNEEAFNSYLNLGIHPAFEDLAKVYSVPSQALTLKLQRILSALAYYSSIFSEVEYLPDLVFPFVKLFAHDELLCFEILLVFFLQWGQHFFEYFPNPPLTTIQATEELLKYHEFDLYTHFKKVGLNMVDYVWPFLKSLFTTILPKEDWLSLMDFLVLNNQEPHYILIFILSYLSYFKEPLHRVQTLEEMEYFLQRQNAVNINHIIKNMRHFNKKTPQSVLGITFKNQIPLIGTTYPIFNLFPEYSVEYHRRVREQTLNEKKKQESRQQRVAQIQSLTEELLQQEQRFREKQEAFVKAQTDRKGLLMLEEERRMQQKLIQETESRERRIDQLHNLEKAIKTSLQQQDRLAQKELHELEKELELQSAIDRQLIRSKVEEEELLDLEFQAALRLNEVRDLRNTEERARKIRTEINYIDRQHKLRDRVWEENLKAEDEEFRLRMNILREKKLEELRKQQELNDKKELDLKLLAEGFEKEMKIKDVERERKLRLIAQDEVFKNEEYMRQFKQEEDQVRKEEEQHMKRVLEEERRNAVRRTDEKISQLEQEKRLLQNDISNYGTLLKDKTSALKRSDFEDKVVALRKEKELRLLEEEEYLQKALIDIEEQRKFQREMQQDLFEKEREYIEKQNAYRTLRQDEERLLQEERAKFAEFREEFRDELNKIEEVREKMADARLTQIRNQNDELIEQNAEEVRKHLRTENMLRHFQDKDQSRSYRNDQSRPYRNDESRSRTEDRSIESQEEEMKGQESRRIYDNQRTGTFQFQDTTPHSKFGRSISSYTYSEAGFDDRTRSASRMNPIREAQDIISRHQHTRSIESYDPRYDTYDYKQTYTRDDISAEESQEQIFKNSTNDFRQSQFAPSSPDDNLTYSSYEASIQ